MVDFTLQDNFKIIVSQGPALHFSHGRSGCKQSGDWQQALASKATMFTVAWQQC